MMKFKDLFSSVGFVLSLFFTLTFTSYSQHLITENIVGNGTLDFVAGNALESGTQTPGAMAEHPNGDIYFTVAAVFTGSPGIYKYDINTEEIELVYNPGNGLNGVAVDADGRVYFCRSSAVLAADEHYIQFVDTDGTIDTLAGNGVVGYPVDGSNARETPVGNPAGLKIRTESDGTQYLYYSGFGTASFNIIQRINLDTKVTERVAGLGGVPPMDEDVPDGSDALTTLLSVGVGLAWDSEGNLYYGTTLQNIKMVRQSDGKIYHVIGTNTAGYSGDGEAATTASINISESGLFVRNEGGVDKLYFSDTNNNRVRVIDLSTGIVTTFAGTGFSQGDDDNPDGDIENNDSRAILEGNITPVDILDGQIGIVFTDLDKRVRKIRTCKNPEVTSVSISQDAICEGDAITLTVNGELNDATKFVWYEGGCQSGDALASGESYIFSASSSTSYFVIGEGGCANTTECAEVPIDVTCRDYFNAFSPNGDGINDFLEIPILDNHPENTVSIYNRWGNLIVTYTNYDNETVYWGGTKSGSENLVDNGTYFMVAESNGQAVVSGWVQVIK